MIKIYFDLDGTIYDLYGRADWLQSLESEDETVFDGDMLPYVSEKELATLCKELTKCGVSLGVITWLPKDATAEYERKCELVKRKWVKRYMPYISDFTAQSYGIPKQKAISKKSKQIFLIDDSAEVCEMWDTSVQRKSFRVSEQFTVIDALKTILQMVK